MADDALALAPLTLSFSRSTQMQQTIDEYFKTLLGADDLPSFPYTALIRRLRVMEVQPRLFRSLAQDETRLATLVQPLTTVPASALCCPTGHSHVWGLPHITQLVSSSAFAATRHMHDALEGQLAACKLGAAGGGSDYRLSVWTALRGPTVLVGSLHTAPWSPLLVAVEVEVRAVQFERAVDSFADLILADVAAANSASASMLVLRLTVVTPARKQGGADTVRTWPLHR